MAATVCVSQDIHTRMIFCILPFSLHNTTLKAQPGSSWPISQLLCSHAPHSIEYLNDYVQQSASEESLAPPIHKPSWERQEGRKCPSPTYLAASRARTTTVK